MIGLQYGEKTITRCYVVFMYYGNVTEGQINRRTDRQTDISISRVSVLTRDKNDNFPMHIIFRRSSLAHSHSNNSAATAYHSEVDCFQYGCAICG